MRPVKQACTDTIEESISSTDEFAPQRKCARVCKGSVPSSNIHFTISHSNNSTSHRTILHKCGAVSWSVLDSLRLEAHKTIVDNELIRPLPAPALLNTREHDGYAGTRAGEAQKPGPATHDRDWTLTEQSNAAHRRINAGDSVPSSRDSVTRVQNLRIGNCPAAPAALPAPPPPTMRNARRPPKPKQMPREYLRCAQSGPVADAHSASTDGGLMQLMGQKHGGQVLCVECAGLRLLWHCQITAVSPVQLLQKRHSSPRTSRWGYLPGWTTARASECSGQWYGRRSATPSELAASTSRRTSGRQPASELPHPRRPSD